MIKFVKETLDEDMGGVSAPMSTLTNTPGVGTATPAPSAGLNTNGPILQLGCKQTKNFVEVIPNKKDL